MVGYVQVVIYRMRFTFLGVLVAACACGMSWPAAAQTSIPRVLYVSAVDPVTGFAHESRLHAGDVITALGQSSGAFAVTATEDLTLLNAPNLANYDAVVFFTDGELQIDANQKAALLQFVSSGKGFVGIHSATDTFRTTWPEYGDMLGGVFENHPWDQLATITVEDQTNRSTKHLGASFAITEEIYQFKSWSRANVHVLLSLDTTSVPPNGSRPDNDYALAWTKPYGAGRVFYTALGHYIATWDDARFQQHVVEGIRWALGDPHDAYHRYLAEGATGTFFDTRIALVNPDPQTTAHVELRFLPESGSIVTTDFAMPPQSRQTVFVDDVPGMESAAFSTVIDSDSPVVVDRTMTWANGQAYGSHAETAVDSPAPQWYFAEGATHGRFDLFYLIQNPSPTQTAEVSASFLPSVGPEVDRTYEVGPSRRLTIQADAIPGLEEAEFAAAFTSSNAVPIIVERAMYLSTPDQTWAGGHDSAGATSLALRWFLAEGATGGFFDTFVLVGNPGTTDASIRCSYLLPDGSVVVKSHTVPARGRLTINLAGEDPLLEQTSASTIIESTNAVPVVVERAMWWPHNAPSWYEGHGSMGTTQTGVTWALADGEAGGAANAKTYVLVATGDNATADSLKLTVFVEGGAPLTRFYPNLLTPNRRFTFDMDAEFPDLVGKRFGVMVESLGAFIYPDFAVPVTPMPLVVERAMYQDAGGVFWAAGTNVVATRIK